jgi:hypothetical protein
MNKQSLSEPLVQRESSMSETQLRHERDLLAQALGTLLSSLGVTRPDAALTGPEFLLCAEDASEHYAAEGTAAAETASLEQPAWGEGERSSRTRAENEEEIRKILCFNLTGEPELMTIGCNLLAFLVRVMGLGILNDEAADRLADLALAYSRENHPAPR